MNARYKYKIGDLINCHIPQSETTTKHFLGIIYARQRERINGWMENVYSVFLQQTCFHNSMTTSILHVKEKSLSKVQ